jgi:hypothetical protein
MRGFMNITKVSATLFTLVICAGSAYFSSQGGYDFGIVISSMMAWMMVLILIAAELMIFMHPISLLAGIASTGLFASKIFAHGLSILSITFAVYSGIIYTTSLFDVIDNNHRVLLKESEELNKQKIVYTKLIGGADDGSHIAQLETQLISLKGKSVKGGNVWEVSNKCKLKKYKTSCNKIKNINNELELAKKLKLISDSKNPKEELKVIKDSLALNKLALNKVIDQKLKIKYFKEMIPESLGVVLFSLILGASLGIATEVLKSAAVTMFWGIVGAPISRKQSLFTRGLPDLPQDGEMEASKQVNEDALTRGKAEGVNATQTPLKAEDTQALGALTRGILSKDSTDESEKAGNVNKEIGEMENKSEKDSIVGKTISQTESGKSSDEESSNRVNENAFQVLHLGQVTTGVINAKLTSFKESDGKVYRDRVAAIALLIKNAKTSRRFKYVSDIKEIRTKFPNATFLNRNSFNNHLKEVMINELGVLTLDKSDPRHLNWVSEKEILDIFNS